ncbi:Cof-type HAD-IIB family hydrolase [Lactobacillus sp. ESL0228]|uniref:Cof-type HAD-IIB family hydrolase n=1 Tax=Lactobacillus sp. ESL0228 TaxID=2069352 RepID=UPI000EFD0CF4|nr:Cof-type HAD-IIB family hydrolase [Lactobacillus sp. ESL0228]RMC49729.1 HAD family phosphatase [Lactobacillus sp. ESL0228]
MMIRLVAIDVDDTLLNSHGRLLESTKKVVKQALDREIKVVLCSGRPLAGVQHFLSDLKITGDDQYVITFNGAVIESLGGSKLKDDRLSQTTYKQIDQYAQKHKVAYNIVDADSQIITSNHNVNRITVIQAWENDAGILIRKPEELSENHHIIKAVFADETEKLDQIEQDVVAKFGQRNYVVRAATNFLEVMHKDVNKGVALEFLARQLRIDANEIMAIGDERNDIPMLDFAGISVVMGNGSNQAKKHADYVTLTNDENGIMRAFNKYVLL